MRAGLVPGRRQRGSISVELALLMPGFIVLIVLSIYSGRTIMSQGAVELAAADAARAASISRSAGAAVVAARAAANGALDEQGLRCIGGAEVILDVSGFSRPLGTEAFVSATVVCNVSLTDIALPGWPSSKEVRAVSVSPLDRYRSRG